jgi:hypothetical protein
MKRFVLIAALLLEAACSGIGSHDAPPGQPPLANMELASFKRQFNEWTGVRLVVLLSPT